MSNIRKAKFSTQQGLAASLGIRQSTVAKWEKGRSMPKGKDIKRVADTLGVTVEQLLDCFKK